MEPNVFKRRLCAVLGLTVIKNEKIPMNAAEKSIIVNAPVAEVYER